MRILLSISVLILTGHVTSAQQQGWWTWMKGAATGSGAATYGTLGVGAPANNPPSTYQAAACWTDSQGNLWTFGGGNGTYSQALFKYSPATNMWTWMHGPTGMGGAGVWGTKGVAATSNLPSSRGMGIVTWTDAQDNLWMFGGWGKDITNGIQGALNDLWKYNTTTGQWTWMSGTNLKNQAGTYGTQGVAAPANIPSGRYETNCGWVDGTGNFWFFGGADMVSGSQNDMWKYNPATNQWTWMKGSSTGGNAGTYGTKGVAAAGNNPPSRWVYCKWKDNNGNFWIFGGTHQSNTQSMNDLWKFDPLTNNWTWMSGSNLKDQLPAIPAACVPSTTTSPQARYENPIAWKDLCGNLWMFGGQWAPGLSVPDINDIWCYKVLTNEWVFVGGNVSAANGVSGTQGVAAAGNIPASHYSSAAWSYNNVFWMFGGRAGNAGSDCNTLWRYYPDTTCAGSTCSIANPIAGFTGNNLSGCAPLTVTFTNTSTGANAWNWNFGDGNTGTGQNPVHTYTAAGTYTVTQIAWNGPSSDTLIQPNYVTVFPSAVAAFTAANDTVCVGQNVTFTNNSTGASSYSWNFGNGNTSTNPNPSASYTATGNYTVTLIAATANGCDDTLTMPLTVLSTSVTSAFTQTAGGCAPVTVNFTNTSSGATTYTWTFGNGNSSIAQNPSATYTAAGTYSVTLISSTNSACGIAADTSYSTVTIGQSPALTALQTNVSCFGGNNGTAGITPSGGSSPYTYLWNNGNTTSHVSNLTSQSYSVTVTDANGCSSVQTITITQPTVLNLTTTNTAATCNSADGTATANPTGGTGPYTYSWNPSGGTTAAATGLAAGNYSCTVTDANGCTQVSSTTIINSNGPTAIAGTSTTIQSGDSTALSASGGTSYSWSPPGGLNNSTLANPIATPTTTTQYCVYVFDASGCYDSACVMIFVTPEPIVCGTFYLPNAFSPNNDDENDVFKAYVNPICVKEFKLTIYNRWGEKVFETSDVNDSWNGFYHGVISNTAVYSFYCRAKLINGKDIDQKGNVSLVR